MKEKIIALNKGHLEQLIDAEIADNRDKCDLNHIDVSNVTSMSGLFYLSLFNGDISKWDVSNVEDMSFMFCKSPFNGDISNWNVSNVTTMERMFDCSEFNGNISNWNVSKVDNMNSMFYDSNFVGDISKWKPYSLTSDIRSLSKAKKINVYWTNYKDQETRNKAIDSYWLEKELQKELIDNKSENKKIKL